MEDRIRRLHEDIVLGEALVTVAMAAFALPGMAEPAEATAPPPPVVVIGDNNAGTVDTTVSAPASPGRPEGRPVPSTGPARQSTCTWTAEPTYSQDYLNWLGGTAGSWYDVHCSDGTLTLAVYVPPGSNSVPALVVAAGTLARSAANSLPLPVPQVRHNPSRWGLVGLPTWFWVDPGQWRVLTQRTSAGPVWAEVTATPESTTWEPGDGSAAVACAGPGTPYDRGEPEAAQASDCSHTYTRSSADQPQQGPNPNDRAFNVSVAVTWQVSWRGSGGSGGVLPSLSRRTNFPLPVAQRQTVVTAGSD